MTGASSAWRNWARNQTAYPALIEHPADVDDVAQIVKQAAEAGRTVKVAGSGHSFTAAAVTDGTLLHLDRLAGVLDADAETGLVTVQAGMPLHVLNRTLASTGLAMSNLGDIDLQTVAGAISTGTHGTGARLGGLATQVRRLEIVLGDGSVVECSATERPGLFSAARVGLGALGVLTAVTLQCEPAFVLHAREGAMAIDRVMADLDEMVERNEHFEFFWFPHTDAAMVKQNNRLEPGEPRQPLSRARSWVEDELLANAAFEVVCQLGLRRPSLIPKINRRSVRLMGARTYTAPSHEVFSSPRRVRFVEMEYAVPRAAVHEAFAAIRAVIEREQLMVSFPVEVRVTKGDDIPLSTAVGRDSAYLAVHMYRGEQDYERFFRAVERELTALDGRPHWGKLHYRNSADLRPVYPQFDEFLAARDEADPERVFRNAYLDRVLGR
ncbi:MAG: FAD-binding protein [Nocardioidaceae bacterium]|nr:FAD-binding protein [Nocardioidaceae bacterium]